ncbi:MAG: hypothetical protein ACK4R6_13315 [Spirosomataceae bacterium]
MASVQLLRQVFIILIYVFLQVFIFRNLVIADVGFCFVYIGIILFIPYETSDFWVILIGFLIGLMVDIFYNTAGVHASATVAMAFVRGFIIKGIFPSKGGDADIELSITGMGSEKFIRYVLLMTMIHHFILFFVEVGHLGYFVGTSIKVIGSIIYTTLVLSFLHRVLK